MSLVSMVALGTGVFCLAMCQYFNLKIMKAQSTRIKALEHFIYPEWAEERGWQVATKPTRGPRSI